MSKDNSLKDSQSFFSIADVDEILKKTKPVETELKTVDRKKTTKPKVEANKVIEQPKPQQQHLGAVSAADILGFSLSEPEPRPKKQDDVIVPKKFLAYYRLLVGLREHVLNGLNYHTNETLHRSSKEDSGDLSGYGQHMADAGTETFDRDFALSLVSSEKEALHEIEKAIERISDGSYGVCEVTGKAIARDRLKAVPFTRFSVEGQIEYEKTQKRTVQRGGAFSDGIEGTTVFASTDDSDE